MRGTAIPPAELQDQLQQKLLGRFDPRRSDLQSTPAPELRRQASSMAADILRQEQGWPAAECLELADQAAAELIGLGPLESLLADDSVSEIMVNGHGAIYVEREGRLQPEARGFSSERTLRNVIERMLAFSARRADESCPMADARLPDGSRINVILPPPAVGGPCLTIRKFATRHHSLDSLVGAGTLSPAMATFLEFAVAHKCSMVVSGGTGSGKTTLLNAISQHIGAGERVITIEDAAELRLRNGHVVSLEARPANLEGRGEITIRDLVRNALRMRPDRIIVGECRGGEALDMLQAMNTGHAGSLTTAHANSPRDLLARLEVMVLMAGMELPLSAIRPQIASAIDLVIQLGRFADGVRRVTGIVEVTGIDSGVLQLQELFRHERRASRVGALSGSFQGCGRTPEFLSRLPSELHPPTDLFTDRVDAIACAFHS